MSTSAVDALLLIVIAAAWLAAAAFVRLGSPFDRLHCVTFVNVTAGAAVLGAALLADGLSSRVAKIALLLLAELWIGAALAHATARALRLRERAE